MYGAATLDHERLEQGGERHKDDEVYGQAATCPKPNITLCGKQGGGCSHSKRHFLFGASQFLLGHVTLVALVAQVTPSRSNEDQCRDAKDDSYPEGLVMNWEIIWRSGWKHGYKG